LPEELSGKTEAKKAENRKPANKPELYVAEQILVAAGG